MLLRFLGYVGAALILASCEAGYYLQAATGQFGLMRAREPIEDVLEDPDTPETLREKLELANSALSFADTELLLPANGSYTKYADLERPYVVWNVFAAPEFSLDPQTWCFPVVGCLAYRGYFAEGNARKYAAKLAEKGSDVFVGGVAAYSTLGRLDDPLLNTMLRSDEERLVGLLFHELTHQKLYVKGDTQFNESFATLVEQEGMIRWIHARDGQAAVDTYREQLARRGEVRALIGDARERLRAVYDSELGEADRRAGKTRVIDGMRGDFLELSADWTAVPFAGWFSRPINNASLAAVSVYEDYVPAFNVLLEQSGHDLETFYRRAQGLADLEPEQRKEALQALVRSPE